MIYILIKKNTHKNRFYNLISSINSIKEEPLSNKANIKRPPVKCSHIYLGYIRVNSSFTVKLKKK